MVTYKDFFNNKFVRILLLVALLPIGLCIFAYYINFGFYLGKPISSEPADWGTFGDFAGGVLNPIYAFLAFLGVVYTVHLQKKQIGMMEDQQKLDELQNLIKGQASTIDEALYGRRFRIKQTDPDDATDIFNILRSISTVALMAEIKPDGPDAMVYQDERATVLGKISYELTFIEEQICFLVWCLQTYESNKGNKDIVEFYATKYRHTVFMLSQIKHLKTSNMLESFFKTSEHKEGYVKSILGN